MVLQFSLYHSLYFLHVSYQSFNNRKAKACILWKDSACFTWFGSLELCSQWNACFRSKACSKKCLPHLLEMYTLGCCTGNLFNTAHILDDVLKILYLLSPSLVLKNMLVVGLGFKFASFAANRLLSFSHVYGAVWDLPKFSNIWLPIVGFIITLKRTLIDVDTLRFALRQGEVLIRFLDYAFRLPLACITFIKLLNLLVSCNIILILIFFSVFFSFLIGC